MLPYNMTVGRTLNEDLELLKRILAAGNFRGNSALQVDALV